MVAPGCNDVITTATVVEGVLCMRYAGTVRGEGLRPCGKTLDEDLVLATRGSGCNAGGRKNDRNEKQSRFVEIHENHELSVPGRMLASAAAMRRSVAGDNENPFTAAGTVPAQRCSRPRSGRLGAIGR